MSYGNARGKMGGVFKIGRSVVCLFVNVPFIILSRRDNIGNNHRIQ
jgi:hypothetical protein